MSQITLSANASGTAIFTVAAPGTSTNQTLTLPDATTTLVGTDATQTLTNKTISGSTIAASQLTGDVAAAQITTALNASGSAPIYACRAWARWNASGTIAASGNVSSVTVVGTGNFTVNFTTAMPDANYAVTGSAGDTDVAGAEFVAYFPSTRIAASSVGMRTDSGGGAPFSAAANSISIFR